MALYNFGGRAVRPVANVFEFHHFWAGEHDGGEHTHGREGSVSGTFLLFSTNCVRGQNTARFGASDSVVAILYYA